MSVDTGKVLRYGQVGILRKVDTVRDWFTQVVVLSCDRFEKDLHVAMIVERGAEYDVSGMSL